MDRRLWRATRLAVPFVAVTLALAACGGDDGGGGGGDDDAGATTGAPTTTALAVDPTQCPVDALPASGAPVEINFWHAMTEKNQATLQQLTDEYNASQSKVKVTLTYQGTYNET